jgi:hypothetical protein
MEKLQGKVRFVLPLVYFLFFLFWLGYTLVYGFQPSIAGKIFILSQILFPLMGGCFGLRSAKTWGGTNSVVGRGVTFISLGLLTWGLGTVFWCYYSYFAYLEVPYPSLADVAYIWSWPLWAVGIWNLGRVMGVQYSLRKTAYKLLLIAIPIFVSIVSYIALYVIARGGTMDFTGGLIKLFFDLFYPIASTVITTLVLLAFLLSGEYLGGKFKNVFLLLLLGFFCNYIADFMLAYTSTTGTFYNGHIADLFFTTSMFLISQSVIMFNPNIS